MDEQAQATAQREKARQQVHERLNKLSQHVLQEENWRRLKMKPRFETTQLSNGYVLKAMIPDLRKEDLSVCWGLWRRDTHVKCVQITVRCAALGSVWDLQT